MSRRTLIWIGLFIGSSVGSWIPTFWGAGFLSLTSALLSAAGGLVGIWAGYQLGS